MSPVTTIPAGDLIGDFPVELVCDNHICTMIKVDSGIWFI